MKGSRLATVLLASAAGAAFPSGAAAARPPGVDALVSAGARARVTTLASPRLHTKNIHTLILAFVVAGGAKAGERVTGVSGDGLRWSRIAHSDGATGAAEVWEARARRWLSGRVVARLAAAAYPASITIVAYGGTASYVASRATSNGRGTAPRIALRPTPGSFEWTAGIALGRRPPTRAAAFPGQRLVATTSGKRNQVAGWVQLAAYRSAHIASVASSGSARSWRMVGVDVVVPSLKRAIEEGLLDAFGPRRRAGLAGGGTALPRYCPPNPDPGFEVGVEDDPVFLGLEPAMSPTRGFELATRVFSASLLRINVIWGEVKKYGWAPYDRAVRMARERCWMVHMTILPTPTYSESYFNSELSAKHYNIALFTSFVSEIAARYAGQVGRFAIGDEPNESYFLFSSGDLSTDMALYDRAYMAGYNAVRSIDPSAQVIAGELGGKHIYEWLANTATLPSNGIAVHAYSMTRIIKNMARYIAPIPLLVSEEGVAASEPNQIQQDLEREEIGRLGGAHEFVFFQLSRADPSARGWDTGIE